jgi:hypothetical protein
MQFKSAQAYTFVNSALAAAKNLDATKTQAHEVLFDSLINRVFSFCEDLGKTEDEIYAYIFAFIGNSKKAV